MLYAVTLNFDEEAQERINELILEANREGTHPFMVENSIPPHLTVSMFQCDDAGAIVEAIDKNARAFKKGDVSWASLAAFAPSVLFIAPVMTKHLMQTCHKIHRLLGQLPGVAFDEYYLPFNWVPHTTLATRLELFELERSFSQALKVFKPFKGTIVELSLVDCGMYNEIKRWVLR
ncbi:MAG: 2'-5' RNA ligase family protein [Clostridiales bacterium]|nr:2'-5' RNA ligase family protein [Clostridiales bacterium]